MRRFKQWRFRINRRCDGTLVFEIVLRERTLIAAASAALFLAACFTFRTLAGI